MKKTSAFGRPTPLPGEAGYGANHTEVLERDTRAMEAQLQMLQLRMTQQEEDDANTAKFKDGSRWASARTDKGTATRYAKDVQAKHKRLELKREERRQQEGRKQVLAAVASIGGGAGAGAGAAGGGGAVGEAGMGMGTGGKGMTSYVPTTGHPSSSGAIGSIRASAAAPNGGAQGRSTTHPASGAKQALPAATPLPHVSMWATHHVTCWLSEYLHLPQYAQVFTENDVGGNVVLELNLEDFDYMGITALGHRKVLLKAVEDLRRTGHITKPIPNPNAQNAAAAAPVAHVSGSPYAGNTPGNTVYGQGAHAMSPASQQQQYSQLTELDAPTERKYAPRILDPAIRAAQDKAEADAKAEADRKMVHWSSVKPLQEQQEGRGVVGDESTLVNTGDIDEEEERRLFQAAVAEWRGQGKAAESTVPKATIIGADGKSVVRKAPKAAVDESMWVNPLGPVGEPSSDLWDDDEPTVNNETSSLPPIRGSPSYKNPQQQDLSGVKGGLLAASMGELDEAAEARAFAAAVAEWRGGGAAGASAGGRNGNQETHSPTSKTAPESIAAGTGTGTSAPTSGTDGRSIADRLAAEMERQQEEQSAAMAAKMAEVRRKLEIAQKQMVQPVTKVLKGSPSPTKSGEGVGDTDDDDDDGDEDEAASSSSSSRAALTRRARQQLQQGNEDSDEDGGGDVYGSITSTTYNHAYKPQSPIKNGPTGAGNAAVPLLSVPVQGDVTSAPGSARSGCTGTASHISPRGGAPPTIQLVATTSTPTKAEGKAQEEEEEQEYYVVEESSDED